MQKTLSVIWIAVFTLPLGVLGQSYAVDHGVVMADGTVSYSSAGGDLHEVEGEKLTSFLFNPSVGYFFAPNLVIGLEALFDSEKQGDSKTTTLGIGPKMAFYFGDSGTDLFPFLGASAVVGKLSNHADHSLVDFTFAAGVTKMIAKNVGLTVKAAYVIESSKPEKADDAIKGNKIGIGIGLSTFIF